MCLPVVHFTSELDKNELNMSVARLGYPGFDFAFCLRALSRSGRCILVGITC